MRAVVVVVVVVVVAQGACMVGLNRVRMYF